MKADKRNGITLDVFTSLPIQQQKPSLSSDESETSSLIDQVVSSFDSATDQKVAAPSTDKVQTHSEESGYSSRASVADRRHHMMEVFKSRLRDKVEDEEGSKIDGSTIALHQGFDDEGATGVDFSYNPPTTNINLHPVSNKTNWTHPAQGTNVTLIENKTPVSTRSPSLSLAGSLISDHGNSTSFESESCAEGERSEVDECRSEVKGDGVMVTGSPLPACEKSLFMHDSQSYIQVGAFH